MEGSQNADDQLTALVAKHKLERKELQGKTLSMKKSISRTDKKKKKELNEQIEKLERTLQKSHEEELDALKSVLNSNSAPPAEPVEPVAAELQQLEVDGRPEQRVTKAQRRREKKTEQARDRQQRIDEQERLNEDGPRQLEAAAIAGRLRASGRAVHAMPSDGDCLYAAVLHQLAGSSCHQSVSALRRCTADQLLRNDAEYRPFVVGPDSEKTNDGDGDGDAYLRYCRLVAETAAWGGHTELAALSAALERRIDVVQAEGAPVVLGADRPSPPLLLTYHRHMYGLGEHYNSTRPCTDADQDGD